MPLPNCVVGRAWNNQWSHIHSPIHSFIHSFMHSASIYGITSSYRALCSAPQDDRQELVVDAEMRFSLKAWRGVYQASPVAQRQRICVQCTRCRRCKFDPWVGKIPWRRAWQPTLVLLPGESHGQRSLEAAVHKVTWPKQLSTMAVITCAEHLCWLSIL